MPIKVGQIEDFVQKLSKRLPARFGHDSCDYSQSGAEGDDFCGVDASLMRSPFDTLDQT